MINTSNSVGRDRNSQPVKSKDVGERRVGEGHVEIAVDIIRVICDIELG